MGKLLIIEFFNLFYIMLYNFILWMFWMLKLCRYLLKFILSVLFYLFLVCYVNCKNSVCNFLGFCIVGCVDKYWGFICDLFCFENCIE